MIKSHIILPRFLLKRFEINNRFCYLDLAGAFISKNGTSKSFNRKAGYYSADAEEYLNSEVENLFAGFLTEFDNKYIESDALILSESARLVIINFFRMIMVRNPMMLDQVHQNSAFINLLPEQNQHDYSAISGLQLAEENSIFSDYSMAYIINVTTIPFVLPACGIYQFALSSEEPSLCIGLPISPKLLVFLYRISGENNSEINSVFIKRIENNGEAIKLLNKSALLQQLLMDKNGRIICSQKEELVRLLDLVKN